MFAVDTSYPIQDDFYQESKIYQEYAPQVRFTFWIAIATGFAMLVILAWLTIVAGRSNREVSSDDMLFLPEPEDNSGSSDPQNPLSLKGPHN